MFAYDQFPAALLLVGEAAPERIPLAIFVVFGSAKLLAELFERLGQPGIVGEIIAGILIGPGVLGWIEPNDFLHTLAELGVMFLLFRVGLEVRASELMQVGKLATSAAVLGVAVPLLAGWAIGEAWGFANIEALFIGTAMVATSVGITAQVLASNGWLQERASRVILAAAVIDDILGLLILAVVSSLARGQVNVLQLAITAALAIGFTILVALWGTQTMEKLVPKFEKKFQAGEVQFNLAVLFLFGMSLLAIHAGVAAIVGGFLAGMALSESMSGRVHDLVHGVTELLLPFFLVGIGLNLDLATFATPATIILAIVILVAAVVSKLVGCGLGALALGRIDALRIGIGMVPRGEVGMVVAQVGLAAGVIDKPLYGVVVFMSVATTLIAPPLLKIAYRGAVTQAGREDFRLG